MGGSNLDVAGALNKLAGTSGLEVQGAANAMLDKLVVISDTEPSSPTENQLWYDTTTETLKRYDGTAFQNGSYSIIAEEVLSATSSTIDFTSIPSTFRHLQVFLLGRTNHAADTTDVYVRFNGDTGSNYDSQRLFAQATSVGGSELLASATGMRVASVSGGNAPADTADGASLVIPHYADTSLQKAITSHTSRKGDNATGKIGVFEYSGWWRSTAAINQVTVVPVSGDFVAGSVFTLVGIKGA